MKVIYSIVMFLTAFPAVCVTAAENGASAGYGIHIMNTAIGFALACTLVIALLYLIRKLLISRSHHF
jgi:flagellar biogenesis protein FliO